MYFLFVIKYDLNMIHLKRNKEQENNDIMILVIDIFLVPFKKIYIFSCYMLSFFLYFFLS